jgi:hypothetical protein
MAIFDICLIDLLIFYTVFIREIDLQIAADVRAKDIVS